MLFLLSVFLATKSKASIILDCEDGWWNLTVQYTASQQIFVPRVGDVTFTLDVLDDGAEVLHWSSDFNEGQINLFSGGALIKTDHLSATNKNAKFNCEITFEGEGLPPLFDKRRNQYLATIGHGDSGDPDILSKNNTEAVLSKWFLKSFNGPDLRGEQILQKADVLGSWGNKTNPYFFVALKLSETTVKPIKKADPFTKIETVDHYKVDCVWEAFVANASGKRLAIETDWNALTLLFYDNDGRQLIFSWNMATARSTVFPSATGERLFFPKRVRGYIGKADTLGLATNKFETKEDANDSAKEICTFNGVNGGVYNTLNDEGFLIEGGGKRDYGPNTVLTVFFR